MLGHLTVFSIFSLSFGMRMPQAEYPNISFWGQLFSGNQFSINAAHTYLSESKVFLSAKPNTSALDKTNKIVFLTSRKYFKPKVALAFNIEKEVFVPKQGPLEAPKIIRREPAIVFHPILPYDFTLYFKDRQVAHAELMYKTVPYSLGSTIMIKRKISSGNLEVDLLSQRYISRYLFMQRENINLTGWRTVKIDLSSKND